jgi:hypothetical protein
MASPKAGAVRDTDTSAIEWQDELRPIPRKDFGLGDGQTLALAATGATKWHVRREGDFLRYGKSK